MLDGIYVSDTKVMIDSFNKYFCSICENLQAKFNPYDNNAFTTYLSPPVKDSMFCTPVTNDEIFQIIHKFKNNKSPGHDNIGPRLVKAVADEIVDPLCYLFNLSFLTGVVPNTLKIAKVIPIYKKGDKSSIENYRPISLLSVFDKILEKLVYGRLYNYLRDYNILYDYQFGFRRHHSTCLALIDVVDQIYQHLDNHEFVLGIYLDQKAFDTVDHKMILTKLFNCGIRGNTHVVGFAIIYPIEKNIYVFLVLILTLIKYHVEFHKVQYLDLCCFNCTSMILVTVFLVQLLNYLQTTLICLFMVNQLKICKLQLCMK